ADLVALPTAEQSPAPIVFPDFREWRTGNVPSTALAPMKVPLPEPKYHDHPSPCKTYIGARCRMKACKGHRTRFWPSRMCTCCWERAKGDYNKERKQLGRSAPKAYHRHNTIEWETPQWFFEQLDAEFGFTLDVCAQPVNAKCPRFFTPEDDGLAQPWEGVCWCNPPYGKNVIDPWIAKARQSAMRGATV